MPNSRTYFRSIYFISTNRGGMKCFKNDNKSLTKPRLYRLREWTTRRFSLDWLNDFSNWQTFSERKTRRIQTDRLNRNLPSLKFVEDISLANFCSLRIFFTNATFDESIILFHKCSSNCWAIERCLKYGRIWEKYSLQQKTNLTKWNRKHTMIYLWKRS